MRWPIFLLAVTLTIRGLANGTASGEELNRRFWANDRDVLKEIGAMDAKAKAALAKELIRMLSAAEPKTRLFACRYVTQALGKMGEAAIPALALKQMNLPEATKALKASPP